MKVNKSNGDILNINYFEWYGGGGGEYCSIGHFILSSN